ncbi:hypothetical protein SmJEL517_g01101 [Synchytrium microbalum]|uniref:Fibronectin type-III domain-containing protein n=1 Tax=Synchytrium microbalum TaxID=1806994 RepID=A0A507CC84_9FUNG|nr:uncharacterized protein SmJEL517_g01101 [Synchytrium microbalum]TPX36948.1 hypothetical protein SmJEL517_g01101 [Synchytrium microbalum]
MAILLSPDHHLIEFPATILPEGITTGSIVNLTIERNEDEERRLREEFVTIQEDIFKNFCTPPEAPAISVKSVTQTSVTIQWKPLKLHSADLRGIDVYRSGQKLSIQVSGFSTSCKLSGLDVNHDYDIWISLRTSAGALTSNRVQVRTHTLENLRGINVCFAAIQSDGEMDSLIALLKRIGASYTEELTTDNTHLVCSQPRGPKYERAVEWNIPAVSPDFLRACENANRIQPAHSYYVVPTGRSGSGDGR